MNQPRTSLRSIRRTLLRVPTHLRPVLMLDLSFETKVEGYEVCWLTVMQKAGMNSSAISAGAAMDRQSWCSKDEEG